MFAMTGQRDALMLEDCAGDGRSRTANARLVVGDRERMGSGQRP